MIGWENPDNPILNGRFALTYLKRMGMGKLGLEAQILEETDMFMEYLEGEVVVDAGTTLAMFTSNNIMQMMFGQRWQYGDSSAVNAIHSLLAKSALLVLGDVVPLFRYLPNAARAKKEANEATGYIRNLFQQIIEKQIAMRDSVESDDFTGAYLQEHETMDKKEVINLVDLCQEMFLAGTDTPSVTLNYVIVHLLNNPYWQEELFHEITAAFQGGVPSMEDLEKLPKLEATIQETLRIPQRTIDPQGNCQCHKSSQLCGACQLPGVDQRLPHQLRPHHLPEPNVLLSSALASP